MSGEYLNGNAHANSFDSKFDTDNEDVIIEIFDVDFIQTGDMDSDTGTLIIEMVDANGRDVERTHRDVPEEVYEAWEQHGFAPAMYAMEIEDSYAYSSVYDDGEEDDE